MAGLAERAGVYRYGRIAKPERRAQPGDMARVRWGEPCGSDAVRHIHHACGQNTYLGTAPLQEARINRDASGVARQVILPEAHQPTLPAGPEAVAASLVIV